MRFLSAVFIAAALAAGSACAQEPAAAAPPSAPATVSKPLKISTRIVTVDVVVTDKNGAPVRGLSRDSFRVLEDGKPQTIKAFDEHTGGGLVVPVPVTMPGTATNVGQESATPALHIILFDALNTAPSDLSFARVQLKKLLADFPAGTRVAIFVLRDELHMVQGFTTDTAQLLTAIDKQTAMSGPWFSDPEMVLLSGSQGNAGNSYSEVVSGSGTAGAYASQTVLGQNAARDEAAMTASLRIAKTLAALNELTERLRTLPGRKNLLWLAGTFPVNLLPDTSTAQGSANGGNEFNDTVNFNKAVQRMALTMELGDIAVYPVQVTGLETDPLFGGANGSRPTLAGESAIVGNRLQQHALMDDIAHQTGGRAIYDDNDLKGAMTEVINQGSEYYTLAYSPANHDWNGKVRKIHVELADKSDKLDYRHDYLAVDPDKIAEQVAPPTMMTIAMERGAPELSAIPFTLHAQGAGTYTQEKDRKPPMVLPRGAPPVPKIKGTAEQYNVSVDVDAHALTFIADKDGKRVPQLAITIAAYDADGKLLNAVIGAFTHPLTVAQYDAVLQHGLTLNEPIELPLGRVFLRAGVNDLNGHKIGSVEMPLIVAGPAGEKTVAQNKSAK